MGAGVCEPQGLGLAAMLFAIVFSPANSSMTQVRILARPAPGSKSQEQQTQK
jgi:hypothetical protein